MIGNSRGILRTPGSSLSPARSRSSSGKRVTFANTVKYAVTIVNQKKVMPTVAFETDMKVESSNKIAAAN